MLVFRIALSKYANILKASGMAARWNFNDIKVIYTASSQSLACLENVVHRSKLGLSLNFSVMHIEILDDVAIDEIKINDLPKNWNSFENMHLTQKIGSDWIKGNKTAILRIPSSIIQDEYNYLINPNHIDFEKITLTNVKPFLFDVRIKN
ncbi:RES family NAD+ phosphorylase [Pedobacter jejuensis]|uniref:RES domain-containing protein n=1 Tax=Pedobacter jejuensis TaxID=1268550 RepID=A0A3N0BZ36_9SPHI|nr:RES family NAD+ phosphorylase [Pedobacter jejuensis]RNL54924.1 RES domain-containing protein [Pedobacter jejuensis]